MSVDAQKLKIVSEPPPPSSDSPIIYVLIFALGVAISGAVVWWFARGRSAASGDSPTGNKDGEFPKKSTAPQRSAKTRRKRKPKMAEIASGRSAILSQFEEVVKKNKDLYRPMPVFQIDSIECSSSVDTLPDFDDETLEKAILISTDESEADTDQREQALTLLSSFRTRNSVEAVSQMALYDLSSRLRSQAVSALAKFDHESVFETILLASTDPAQEVRAAAARGLFSLSFDRTEAWTRIVESNDNVTIQQSARAVSSSSLVDSALDRLTHSERRSAAEALAMIRLLLRAGETKEILTRLSTSNDVRFAKAIMHAIKLSGEDGVLEELSIFLETFDVNEEIRTEIASFLESNITVAEEAVLA